MGLLGTDNQYTLNIFIFNEQLAYFVDQLAHFDNLNRLELYYRF